MLRESKEQQAWVTVAFRKEGAMGAQSSMAMLRATPRGTERESRGSKARESTEISIHGWEPSIEAQGGAIFERENHC